MPGLEQGECAGSQAAPHPHQPKSGLKGREDGGNEIGKKSRFSYSKGRAGLHMKPLLFSGGLLTTFKAHSFPFSDFPFNVKSYFKVSNSFWENTEYCKKKK